MLIFHYTFSNNEFVETYEGYKRTGVSYNTIKVPSNRIGRGTYQADNSTITFNYYSELIIDNERVDIPPGASGSANYTVTQNELTLIVRGYTDIYNRVN